jgi:hypothetical protein
MWFKGVLPHHFEAAPGKNFDAAPAPTLLNTKQNFVIKVTVTEGLG